MTERERLDLLMDLSLVVTARVGRCTMRMREVLQLGVGSIVSLDREAAEPIDLLVNDKLVARGEIVAIDERFGVRLTEVLAEKERER